MLSSNKNENVLFMIQAKLATVLLWTMFVVFHLAVALVLLSLLWWHKVQPEQISVWLHSLSHSNAAELLGFLGFGFVAVLIAYAKMYRFALGHLLTNYLFSN
jgi:hypothetical protein